MAVDGVVEINAQAAQQGGITPGDGPGFPATLSARGSYRLTGNLLTLSRSTPLIEITSEDVSLDLNGFTVGSCVSGGLCGIGSAAAIDAAEENVRIHNGIVRGAGGSCVQAGMRADIRDLHVAGCGSIGILASSGSRIRNVTVRQVGSVGVFFTGTGTLLQDSVISGSAAHGVNVLQSALLVNTVIRDNGGAVTTNGFSSSARGGYRGCLITQNDGTNEVQPITTVLRNLGGNICGTDSICP